VLLVLIPGLIWGASFLFIAEGLQAIGPNGIAFVRILIGFVTLACFPGSWKSVPRSDWLAIVVVGTLWMALPLTLFPHAEQHVSSAITGMLNSTVPLFAAIVGTLVARQLPPRGVLNGLLVGMLGAALMALPTIREGQSSATGALLILGAVASYGGALNVAGPLQQRNALPVIWRALAVALVLTAPLGIPDLVRAHWSPLPLLSLIALGALGTGVAYVLLTVATGRVGATRASATNFLIAPVALLLGVTLRGEQASLNQWSLSSELRCRSRCRTRLWRKCGRAGRRSSTWMPSRSCSTPRPMSTSF
jgi:drug/metabolite transporter (DMT)-like permease